MPSEVDLGVLEYQTLCTRRDGVVTPFIVKAKPTIKGAPPYGFKDGYWRHRDGRINDNGVDHKFDIVGVTSES